MNNESPVSDNSSNAASCHSTGEMEVALDPDDLNPADFDWPDPSSTKSPDFVQPERPNIDELDSATIDRVLEMAWEDRTTFDIIEQQFGLKEQDVIETMRRHMKRSSFKMWRKRVTARKTKHAKRREFEVGRFKSSNQKNY